MDIDPEKNLTVAIDLTALGASLEADLRALGRPWDPCAHRIYQPMAYCAECRAHKQKVAQAMADQIDAQALARYYTKGTPDVSR